MYQTRYCRRSIYFLSDKYQLSMHRSTLILSLKFGCKVPLTALSRLMVVLYYFFTKFWSYNKSVSYHAYILSHGKLLLLSWILRLLLITMWSGEWIYVTGNSIMVAARTFGSSGNKSIDHKTFRSRKISLGLATGLLPLDLSIAGITTSRVLLLLTK
jgi:hypothetical protein